MKLHFVMSYMPTSRLFGEREDSSLALERLRYCGVLRFRSGFAPCRSPCVQARKVAFLWRPRLGLRASPASKLEPRETARKNTVQHAYAIPRAGRCSLEGGPELEARLICVLKRLDLNRVLSRRLTTPTSQGATQSARAASVGPAVACPRANPRGSTQAGPRSDPL